jgi:hypothetical protein
VTNLPTPTHQRNMRLIGHSDQGGRPDAVQVMVHRDHAYVGHIFSNGFSVIDLRDPEKPRPVAYIPAPPNTWCLHLQTHDDLLLVIHNKNMFAQADMADEKAYYKGRVAQHAAGVQDWSASMAVYDISTPAAPREIGFMPVQGTGAAPDLVHWRAVGLCFGPAGRVHGLHPDHHRHGRSDQARDGRKILAAGYECCRRRSPRLAIATWAFRAASSHCAW